MFPLPWLLLLATWPATLVLAAPFPYAYPSPEVVPVTPVGLCKTPGEFVCISDHTFALCPDSLIGVEQILATGDGRCLGKGPGSSNPNSGSQGTSAPPPSSPSSPHGSTHGGATPPDTSSPHGSTHGGAPPPAAAPARKPIRRTGIEMPKKEIPVSGYYDGRQKYC
jgi:hypothetical protein